MRKAHFLFSKGGTDPTPWGVGRCPQAAKSPYRRFFWLLFFVPAVSKKSNKRTLLCNFNSVRLLFTTFRRRWCAAGFCCRNSRAEKYGSAALTGTEKCAKMIPVRVPPGFGVIFSNAGYSGLPDCHFYGRALDGMNRKYIRLPRSGRPRSGSAAERKCG